MIREMEEVVVLRGTLKMVAAECVDLKAKGFNVVKVKTKLKWPRFWIRVYKVRLKKDYIIDFDSEEIIHTPIDLDA